MNELIKTIKGLGKTKLISLGAIMLSLLIFFGFLISSGSKSSMVIVSDEIDTLEMGKVIEKLDEMNITYQITDKGVLMVDKDEKNKVLITLASLGIKTNIVGYELFDKLDSFSATSFMQNINNIRAIEGEITRSILTFENITNARVHINIPKKSIFNEEEFQPKAAVILCLRRNKKIEDEQIKAIQNLVASSVSGMKTKSVKIMDSKGRLLSSEETDDSIISDVKNYNELKFKYENHLKTQLEDILEKSIGIGKVRIKVNADMDFTQFTESSENFDPDSKVTRSEHLTDEKTDELSKENQMTIEKEIQDEGTEKTTEQSKNNSSKKEELKNYEISKVVKSLVKAPGEIKQISVAILVDGTYKKDPNTKELTYSPRTKEELEQIANLVKSAIGFKKERNDKVEVINMKFQDELLKDEPEISPDQYVYGFKKDSVLSIIDKITIGLILMFVIVVIIRPIVEKAVKLGKDKALEFDDILKFAENIPNQQEIDMLNMQNASHAGKENLLNEENEIEDKINIQKIDVMINRSAFKGITELIDKHTERTIVVIREWLNEES